MTETLPSKPSLPVTQLAILAGEERLAKTFNVEIAVVRFAEPMAYTSVFPYLPEMIRDFGVEQNKIAKWAGITSATFSICQAVAAVPWGKASDRFGRKPVVITGLLSTMVCFIIWGMSTSLPMAITVRAIQGIGNGNVGIIRTMVAEMVPRKELQARAFSIMPLVWSLGTVIGPAFGGFFAQPAKRFPDVFGGIEYFRRFPFALPNLIATVFFLISATSAIFFLRETLASKRDKEDWGLAAGQRISRALSKRPLLGNRRRSFIDGEATAPLIDQDIPSHKPTQDDAPPSMREVFTRQTSISLLSYTFLAFHSVAYDQNISLLLNYPVMKHTSRNTVFPFYFNGGFGLDTGKIGTIFTVYGVVAGLIQFVVYPPLVNRFGILRCFKICSIILPCTYILTPYTTLFPTSTTRLVALIIVMIFKAFGIMVAFPSMTIMLTNSCSSLSVLGTLNGFATAFSGLGRALGPASTGIVFSWGVERGSIVAAYLFLGLFGILGAISVFFLEEGNGPTASDAKDTDDCGDHDASASSDECAIEDSSDDEADDRETHASTPLLSRSESGPRYSSIQATRG